MTSGAPSNVSRTLLAPLLLGSLLNPINSTMLATAMAPIGRDLGVGAADTAWLVASLYVTSAVAQPTMGQLADRWGPRRVYLLGLALVLLSGVGGALSHTLGELIAVRVVLGLGTSAAYPSAMKVLRQHAERTGVPTPRPVLGLLSLASQASTTVGPTLGGLLVGLSGWRAIFLVNVPLALVGLVLATIWIAPDAPPSSAAGSETAGASAGTASSETVPSARLDVTGIVLFTAAIVAAMFFLMKAREPRWWLVPIVVTAVVALIAHSRRHPRPFLDVRMLARNAPLRSTYVRFWATALINYAVLYGFAQWIQEAHGATAAQSGLLTLPQSVLAAITTVLGARTRTLRGPLIVSVVGLLVGSLGLLALGDGSPSLWIVLVGAAFGVAQGLVSVATQAAVYQQAPAAEMGTAAGLQRTAAYLGAVGASGLLGFFFGQRATTGGLHSLAVAMSVFCVALLVATIADRTLRDPSEHAPDTRP